MLIIGTDVNNEKAEIAIEEIYNELIRLTQEDILPSEFELAKNHLLGSLQLEISNPFIITDKIKNIYLNKLHQNYYTLLFKAIANTTSERLKELALRYLQPTDMLVVQVGG